MKARQGDDIEVLVRIRARAAETFAGRGIAVDLEPGTVHTAVTDEIAGNILVQVQDAYVPLATGEWQLQAARSRQVE